MASSRRRKVHRSVEPATSARPLAASTVARASLPTAAALRALLVVSIVTTGCDAGPPSTWGREVERGVRRVGTWLHVLDEPVPLAGAEPAVHPAPLPPASASPSVSPSASASPDHP